MWGVPPGADGRHQLCWDLPVPGADCLHGPSRVYRKLHSCPLSGGELLVCVSVSLSLLLNDLFMRRETILDLFKNVVSADE